MGRTSLAVQWIRIRLPMQETWVRSLGREDSRCLRATKPTLHNHRAQVLEPAPCNYWVHMSLQLKPVPLEPVVCSERIHCNDKARHHNWILALLATNRESLQAATETQHNQK